MSGIKFNVENFLPELHKIELREIYKKDFIEEKSSSVSFIESGGFKTMEDQIQDGALKKRARGTRANAEQVCAVIDLKKQGMTQAEAARELGLPKSTVQRYWQKA